MALLEVRDLVTEFPTRRGVVRAVNGVSFSVDRGEILAVVGELGSGKSVTSLSIMGLLQAPGHVASGSITFEGRDVLAASERELERMRGGEDRHDLPGAHDELESRVSRGRPDRGGHPHAPGYGQAGRLGARGGDVARGGHSQP